MRTGLGVRVAALVFALALAMVPCFALAGSVTLAPSEDESTTQAAGSVGYDSAGNAASAQSSTTLRGVETESHRDLVAAGERVAIEGASVGGDILAAGSQVAISNSEVEGSIRAAGQTVIIDGLSASNATLAGEVIDISSGSQFAGAYLAGRTVTFNGAAQALLIASQSAVVNGVVDGDVEVFADTVVIGPDARITGTLHVTAPNQPTIPETATVGSVTFDRIETSTTGDFKVAGFNFSALNRGEVQSIAIAAAIIGVVILINAVLLALFLRGAVEGSARMLRTRTAPMLISGVVGTLLSPLVLLLLFLLLVTLPLGFGAMLMLGVVSFVSVPFTAASISRAVLPKWHRVATAAIFGLLFGAMLMVPYLGTVLSILCFMYMIGYLIQLAFIGMHRRNDDEAGELPPAQPVGYTQYAPVASPVPSSGPMSGFVPSSNGYANDGAAAKTDSGSWPSSNTGVDETVVYDGSSQSDDADDAFTTSETAEDSSTTGSFAASRQDSDGEDDFDAYRPAHSALSSDQTGDMGSSDETIDEWARIAAEALAEDDEPPVAAPIPGDASVTDGTTRTE